MIHTAILRRLRRIGISGWASSLGAFAAFFLHFHDLRKNGFYSLWFHSALHLLLPPLNIDTFLALKFAFPPITVSHLKTA